MTDRRFPWQRRRRKSYQQVREEVWELRRRVRELEGARADLTRILDGLGEGVLAVDATGIVLYVNAVAMDLLGMESGACTGSHLFVAVPHEAVSDAVEDIMRGDEAGAVVDERHREFVVERDGVEHTLLLSVSPLRTETVPGESGSTMFEGAIAVVRDVTELRRLEGARQEFFTNVSHELKTPITAIRGALETIEHDDEMPDEVRSKFLRSASSHAVRLGALVTDLLALARLERDPETLARQPVDLAVLAGEVLRSAESSAERAQVTLSCSGADSVVIDGDEEALRQALTNLVDNAVAHSPEGAEVRVEVRDEGAIAELAVHDQGEGIPADAVERVFERFYRVDTARSRARGGTGIGLSIVKHVAQAHGGTVAVESELGVGSSFRLRVPVSRSPRVGTPEGR